MANYSDFFGPILVGGSVNFKLESELDTPSPSPNPVISVQTDPKAVAENLSTWQKEKYRRENLPNLAEEAFREYIAKLEESAEMSFSDLKVLSAVFFMGKPPLIAGVQKLLGDLETNCVNSCLVDQELSDTVSFAEKGKEASVLVNTMWYRVANRSSQQSSVPNWEDRRAEFAKRVEEAFFEYLHSLEDFFARREFDWRDARNLANDTFPLDESGMKWMPSLQYLITTEGNAVYDFVIEDEKLMGVFDGAEEGKQAGAILSAIQERFVSRQSQDSSVRIDFFTQRRVGSNRKTAKKRAKEAAQRQGRSA